LNKLYEYHTDADIMFEAGIIRTISPSDLNQLVEIEQICFHKHTAYSRRQLKYLITKAKSICLAECYQQTLRGFIIVTFRGDGRVAGIETLNVDPLYRGKGIGKKLLAAAEENMFYQGLKKLKLEVSMGNHRAIALYEKSGFRRVSILKNYYWYRHHGTRNAYQMIKKLTT